MNDIISQITLDPEVRKDPKELGKVIIDLATEIDSCKDDLAKLRDRGVFKRIFANNTRDVAEVMIRQNDSMSLFLHIVQALTFLNFYNTAKLGAVYEELCRVQGKKGEFSNKYIGMATAYMSEALDAARRLNEQLDSHEDKLNRHDQDLHTQKEMNDAHNRIISDLIAKHAEHDNQNIRQDVQISHLNSKLSEHEAINEDQTDCIQSLGRELKLNAKQDEERKKEVAALRRHAHHQASAAYGRKLTVVAIVAIVALVLSVINMAVSLVRP